MDWAAEDDEKLNKLVKRLGEDICTVVFAAMGLFSLYVYVYMLYAFLSLYICIYIYICL